MAAEPKTRVTISNGVLESIEVRIGDDIRVFTRGKLKKLRRRSDASVKEHPYDQFECAAIKAYFAPPSDESFAQMEQNARANSLGYTDPEDRVSTANGG